MATVVVASDHAGFEMKQVLKALIADMGHQIADVGTNDTASVDYPDFGAAAAKEIRDGRADLGVLVCGSGIGISIAANREPAVRAALCHDVTTTRLCRLHNDANVLALGSRVTGIETAKECVRTFLTTDFEGGRHQRRVDKLGQAPDNA
ncbi:ribose 5-phosphate isomerase B [Minwuia sp.]|uniref:ribose 5-phosphate isomerase B n=1 Tax=Minwuia sp. TaxID=2493630 RepID=UPI003A924D2C